MGMVGLTGIVCGVCVSAQMPVYPEGTGVNKLDITFRVWDNRVEQGGTVRRN